MKVENYLNSSDKVLIMTKEEAQLLYNLANSTSINDGVPMAMAGFRVDCPEKETNKLLWSIYYALRDAGFKQP